MEVCDIREAVGKIFDEVDEVKYTVEGIGKTFNGGYIDKKQIRQAEEVDEKIKKLLKELRQLKRWEKVIYKNNIFIH